MSNETKQDVFERALTEWYDLIFKVGGQGNEAYGYSEFDATLSKYEKDYNNALPDDLPVIPKAVSDYIRWCKGSGGIGNVSDAISYAISYASTRIASWIYDERNSDTFARAWLDGVWRVDENGEIVKLEVKERDEH